MSIIKTINGLLEDLQGEIDTKAERIAKLENKNEDLELKIDDLEQQLAEAGVPA